MKIKSILINNFKGINCLEFIPGNKTVALIGKNGIGKTSFLEAVRFALTGDAPNNCITDGATESTVLVRLEDGNEFSRTKYVSKPTKIRVNGRTTTAKNLETLLATITGLSDDALRIATSSEVLAGLKPSEFGDFIMGYIPEKLDFDTICSYIPGITPECIDELSVALPSMPIKFGMDEIKSAQDYLIEERKNTNKEVQVRKAKVSTLFDAPLRTLKEIEDELSKVMELNGSFEAAKTALRMYEDAVRRDEEAKKRIKDTEAEIASISVFKPNAEELSKILGEKNVASKTIVDAEKLKQTLANDIALFEHTVETLDESVCPLSEKLVCTTDKTKLREEFLDIVSANKEGLEIQNQIILKAKEHLLALDKKESDFRERDSKYKEKIMLTKRLEELKKSIPLIPDKPIIPESDDFKSKITALQKERDEILRYQQQQKEIVELEKLMIRYDTLNYLCKAVQPKGPVMDAIISHYLSVFETVINNTAKNLRVDFLAKFISDDGIVLLIQTDASKEFKPYESLSNGEKIFTMFLLLNMINSLCGSRLLLMDDLNHLDEKSFKELFTLIMSPSVQDAYDHIFLCSVDNTDITTVIRAEKNIDLIF